MTFVDELAQAALRGFFGDAEGFKNMDQDASRKAAAREVRKVLTRYFSWWAPQPEVTKKSEVHRPIIAKQISAHTNGVGGKKEHS